MLLSYFTHNCYTTWKLFAIRTDKENAEVLGPHFEKVFNNHRPIEWKVMNEIKQRQTMHELNKPISWAELKTSIGKLTNDKAPGLNKAKFSRDNNSPLSDGQLISHQPRSFNRGALFDIFCMIYINDGAFVFESRHQ